MPFKILFVGLGSIGKRHLGNISKILTERKIEFSIDALRRNNEPFDGIANVYTSYDDIPSDYDVIFITNPTSLHYEAITALKNKTKNFFIEKPIFNEVKSCEFSKGVNYVACPLRHHPVVKALRDFVQSNKVISFRVICSSYLPDWRKGVDYRKVYSANAAQGGGVDIDLIHEIDYVKWLFGNPVKLTKISSHVSDLEIDTSDISLYLYQTKNALGSIHLDYIGRYNDGAKREIEVFTNDKNIIFDLAHNKVDGVLLDKEDMYVNEINYFIDHVLDPSLSTYYNQPSEAFESLKIALGD